MLFLETTPINLIGIYQKVFCIWLAIVVLTNLPKHRELILSNVLFLYGPAKKIVNRITIGQLNLPTFVLSGIVLALSLLLAGAGVFPRTTLAVALCFYFIYFSQLIVYEDVGRKTHMMPFMLSIFILSPGLELPWNQPNAYWPIWMAKLVVVQMYVSAAIQKLKNTGLRWADGSVFRQYLIAHDLWHGMSLARRVAERPRLCCILSSCVLMFQLSIWLILIWPELTLIYAVAGLGFHIGTSLIMRIHYLKYLSGSYLILFIEPLTSL